MKLAITNVATLKFTHMFKKLLTTLLLSLNGAAFAQVQLVTADEANRPDQTIAGTRAISRGPSIKLLSNPSVDAKSFQFKIAMERLNEIINGLKAKETKNEQKFILRNCVESGRE